MKNINFGIKRDFAIKNDKFCWYQFCILSNDGFLILGLYLNFQALIKFQKPIQKFSSYFRMYNLTKKKIVKRIVKRSFTGTNITEEQTVSKQSSILTLRHMMKKSIVNNVAVKGSNFN